MSQYPSPYSPPPYPQNLGYYAPQGVDPLRPAKRAGLLMIAVGAVAVLLSLCMIGAHQALRTTALPPELAAKMQEMEAKSGVPAATVFAMFGGAFLLIAVFQIVIGILVRTGRKIPIVLALIGTSMVLLLLGLFVLSGVVGVLSQPDPQVIAGIIFFLVPLALLTLQLAWLIGAARAGRQTALAMQQYAAQYWQYQQNMQTYGGYGQVPPPPARKDDGVTG